MCTLSSIPSPNSTRHAELDRLNSLQNVSFPRLRTPSRPFPVVEDDELAAVRRRRRPWPLRESAIDRRSRSPYPTGVISPIGLCPVAVVIHKHKIKASVFFWSWDCVAWRRKLEALPFSGWFCMCVLSGYHVLLGLDCLLVLAWFDIPILFNGIDIWERIVFWWRKKFKTLPSINKSSRLCGGFWIVLLTWSVYVWVAGWMHKGGFFWMK